MKAELSKLIELQKTDTNLRRLKQALETADERRAEIEQEFEQHAFSIREIQKKRDDLNASRADLEKQIAENKTYLERAERNLKHAENSKEYETAMRETDALQKQISAFETQIVEAMDEVERVEKELEDRADEINSHDAKRDAALSEFTAQLAADRANSKAKLRIVEAHLPLYLTVWRTFMTAWRNAAATVSRSPRLSTVRAVRALCRCVRKFR